MAFLEGTPTLNIYTSINGSQSFGNQALEELGSVARIPFRTINNIRPQKGDNELALTAISIKTSDHSPEYFINEKDLDSVSPNLKDNLRDQSAIHRYSALSRRMQALTDKYNIAKRSGEKHYSGYVDWKVTVWKTISFVQVNPLKQIPKAPHANLLGNSSIIGTILCNPDGSKIFQIETLKDCPSARLPVVEVPENYQATETDLVIVGPENRYVCKKEAYSPILGAKATSNVQEVTLHLLMLSITFQNVKNSLDLTLKNVVEWQDPFFKLLVQMDKVTDVLETAKFDADNAFKISSKRIPEVPFGCYAKAKGNPIFRIKILLGNGASKDVRVAYSPRKNKFSARTKLNTKIFPLKRPVSVALAKQCWKREVEIYREIEARQKKGEVLPGLPIVEDIIQIENDGSVCWEVSTNIMDSNLINFINQYKDRLPLVRDKVIYNILQAVYTYQITLDRAHGDVKGDNILINSKLEVNLIDFGHSRKVGEEKGTMGSYGYVPPEDLLPETDYYARDAWATGVVLYTVAFGRAPCFFSPKKMDLNVFRGKVAEFHKLPKPSAYRIIWDLCHPDPKMRAKITDIFPKLPKPM